MSFYECGLKAIPEGSDSPSRLGLSARRLGYRGIIICNSDPGKIFRPEVASELKGIEVAWGVELTGPNPKVLRSRVASLRKRVPFITVKGGTEEMNRAACEDPNVDVLFHSENSRHMLGIAAARAAKQNQVAIGFDLSPLIRLRARPRARWMEALSRNLDLVRKFGLSMIITAGARSHLDLRAPRDLMALAVVAGFEPQEAKDALKLPGMLLELNRRVWLAPGVELL